MLRVPIEPRQGWQANIEEQGLIYWKTEMPDGSVMPYWNESAYYSVTEAEVFEWEATARIMMEMLVEAGDFIIEHNLFARMGIPGWMVPRIKETWESEPPMLYGRFDFALDPDGKLKLLEYNADTPTCIVETVCQWYWLMDKFGEGGDQWNRVHEALVERWTELKPRIPGDTIHFLHTRAEDSGEDFMTVAYLVETAKAAGFNCEVQAIEDVQANGNGFTDVAGLPLRTAFKLYPWEWMAHEEFCQTAIERMGTAEDQTTWIEPVWKMLWSNKGILPVLWHLYPGHENLVPAYFIEDHALVDVFGNEVTAEQEAQLGPDYVRKPLLGREGADTQIVMLSRGGHAGTLVENGPKQGYGEEGFVAQQFVDLGTYDGQHPVLGVWTVDMEPQGMGIRESPNLITNNLSRFTPHAIQD